MNVWPIIRALTLHRPWDRYMAHGRKPIENREWMPPEWMLQQLIALHAGQHWDSEAAAWIVENFRDIEHGGLDGPSGSVVSVVRLVAVVDRGADPKRPERRIIRGALPSWWVEADWRWFFGRYGWVVADPAGGRAQPLGKPVAARGFQKLWHLPAEAEAAVLEQVKVA